MGQVLVAMERRSDGRWTAPWMLEGKREIVCPIVVTSPVVTIVLACRHHVSQHDNGCLSVDVRSSGLSPRQIQTSTND